MIKINKLQSSSQNWNGWILCV